VKIKFPGRFFLKKFLSGNPGFTLVEVLIATALTGLIATALGTTSVQLIKYQTANSNKISIIRSLDTAETWLNRDFQSVSSIKKTENLTPGNGEIQIIQSIKSEEDTTVTYLIDSNQNLIRQVATGSETKSYIIANNITSVVYSPSINDEPNEFTLTAQKGQTTLNRNIEVKTRIIKQGVWIKTSRLPNVVVGQSYSYQLQATGGAEPYTWTFSDLSSKPSWLNISSSGVLSGTAPSKTGLYIFSLKVTDSNSKSYEKTFSIEVVLDSASISTVNAINITKNSCVLAGDFTFGGTAEYYNVYFEYGKVSVSEKYTYSLRMYNSGEFTIPIFALDSNTTYFYRAVAKGVIGGIIQSPIYGNQLSFKTLKK